MSDAKSNTGMQLLLVAAFAGLGGASFWYWGAPGGEHARRALENQRARTFAQEVEAEPDSVTDDALAYIEAVENCDCEAIASRTAWYQERRARLVSQNTPLAELERDRAAFCEVFCGRVEGGFRLMEEGVEDGYLFFPGAVYRPIGRDGGRRDLEAPVAGRAWIEVTFPSPAKCLRDAGGNTIKSISVGLNVSPEGRIVKAGVIGNAEIAWDTVQYGW